LPASVQVKLLRFLQEKSFQRVGGRLEIQSDVRVVAATNQNLQESVAAGRFREDLYYRLAVIVMRVPALRERSGDSISVAKDFLQKYGLEHAKPGLTFAPDALRAMTAHSWPGNVRELQNRVQRAVIMADGGHYRLDDFPLPQRSEAASLSVVGDSLNLDQLEKQMIERALRMHHFNVSLAASELGLSRGALYRRMEKHGL